MPSFNACNAIMKSSKGQRQHLFYTFLCIWQAPHSLQATCLFPSLKRAFLSEIATRLNLRFLASCTFCDYTVPFPHTSMCVVFCLDSLCIVQQQTVPSVVEAVQASDTLQGTGSKIDHGSSRKVIGRGCGSLPFHISRMILCRLRS